MRSTVNLLSGFLLLLASQVTVAETVFHGTLPFDGGKILAELSIDTSENQGDEHFMTLKFTEAATQNPLDQNFKVSLWMTMDGKDHPSARTYSERVSPGVYRISNMYFVMTGNWRIRVTTYGFLNWEESHEWAVEIDASGSMCGPAKYD